MPARTGANTVVGISLNSIIDSHVAATTGEKVLAAPSFSANTTTLERSPIGGGLVMIDRIDDGATTPGGTLAGEMDFDSPRVALLAQMFGTENVSSLGSGAYVHSIIPNATANTDYACIAFHSDSANVHEYRNAVVTAFEMNMTPNAYVDTSITVLATEFKNSSTTNTAAGLAALTLADSEPVITRPVHKVRLNAQAGGALADGDLKAVVSCVISHSREQELVPEIRGSAGNGAPRSSGNIPFEVRFTLTFKVKEDETWYTSLINGTEWKMDCQVLGTLIGGSVYRTIELNVPRCKVDGDPQYNVTNTGENELVVNFRALAAASAATGMPCSVYPYYRIINTRSTKYKKS